MKPEKNPIEHWQEAKKIASQSNPNATVETYHEEMQKEKYRLTEQEKKIVGVFSIKLKDREAELQEEIREINREVRPPLDKWRTIKGKLSAVERGIKNLVKIENPQGVSKNDIKEMLSINEELLGELGEKKSGGSTQEILFYEKVREFLLDQLSKRMK